MKPSTTKLTRQERKNPNFRGKFRVIDFDTSDNEAHLQPIGSGTLPFPVIVFCSRVMKIGEIVKGCLSDHPSRDPLNIYFIEEVNNGG